MNACRTMENRSRAGDGLRQTTGGNIKVKVSTLALTTVVLPALLFACPWFGGGKGLFRIQNAMVEPEAA